MIPEPRRRSFWPLLVIVGVLAIASVVAWRLGYFEATRRNELIAAIGDVRRRDALYSWAAALIGTIVAHSVARRLNTGAIRRLFGQHRVLQVLRSRADIPFLIRMRLMPIAPFGVLDYVAGLAGSPRAP